ncbi:MAG: WG repeat-containing protein, partial [Oscillospiraceae bacterium]
TTTLTHDGLPYSLKELPLYQAYGGSYFVFPCPLPEGTSPLLRAAPDLGGRFGPNGLMDWAGNWVVPPTYAHIDDFGADGVARVKAGNFYGFISTSGKVVLPPKYPYATQFHDGVLVVGDENGPFTAYDTTGKKLGILPSDCNYNNTSGGFIQYRDGEKYGFLNADGSVALKAAYDKVYPVSMGYAPVGIGRQRGFVDLKGNVTVPFIYDLIASGFGPEGYAVVGRGNTQSSPLHYDGKLGMVDTAGKEVIPFLYDNLEPFADGKAPFVRGHVTGYLTPEGREVPDPKNPTEPQKPDPLAAWLHLTRPHGYELITEIQDGKAVVLLGGRYYLLTLTQ